MDDGNYRNWPIAFLNPKIRRTESRNPKIRRQLSSEAMKKDLRLFMRNFILLYLPYVFGDCGAANLEYLGRQSRESRNMDRESSKHEKHTSATFTGKNKPSSVNDV